MKTYLECIPCFINQTLKSMELNNLNQEEKKKIIKEVMKQLSIINFDKKPPEFAKFIYKLLFKLTGNPDPYKEIKRRDNNNAIDTITEIEELCKTVNDPLLFAVKVAVIANIMDFAANINYNIKDSIEKSMDKKFSIDHYDILKKNIIEAKHIIYLADNCGEIVFDKLLIESIQKINKVKIYLFVKEKPILNDATEEDLKYIGIDKIPNIEVHKIKTGFPDINFLKKSKYFSNITKDSHLIISKGQANYESLSELENNIFFLLVAKCKIIARDLNVNIGDLVCKSNIYRGK